MKTVGIIAEYNPFHNGHKYQIEQARKKTGADYCVAAISGNFVQRGAPAILNKYIRARMALENGADLVLELPTVTSVSSAEGFASGGVSLFDSLHAVDFISFGAEVSESECEKQKGQLSLLATLYETEPVAYKNLLSHYLRLGNSFPKSRSLATMDYLSHGAMNSNSKNSLSIDAIDDLTGQPNNILAIEYLRAMMRYDTKFRPCIIPRKDSGYHNTSLSDDFSSATAIRKSLLDNSSESADSIVSYVPDTVFPALRKYTNRFLSEDDFSDFLYYALTSTPDHLSSYCSDDLAHRIRMQSEYFQSWSQFCELLKTKNQTHTGISRSLLRIMLGITNEDISLFKSLQYVPYIRILGFRRQASALLKEIQSKADKPLILHPAKDSAMLTPEAMHFFQFDLHASDLYNRIVYKSSGDTTLCDYRHPLIYL